MIATRGEVGEKFDMCSGNQLRRARSAGPLEIGSQLHRPLIKPALAQRNPRFTPPCPEYVEPCFARRKELHSLASHRMSHPIHLILSPGTRIVTRNDANRIGGGVLVPAGAVAVITDSPADAHHAYKVRGNDGAEAMLRRNEFSILKEFKNDEAMGRDESVGRDSRRADTDFVDWQRFIIYRCVVGSQAFGLSGDDSDVDRGGIYLPPAALHWSLYGVPEQIENNDTQEAYWELQKSGRAQAPRHGPQSQSEHPRNPCTHRWSSTPRRSRKNWWPTARCFSPSSFIRPTTAT